MSEKTAAGPESASPKNPYAKPRLIEYGPVEKLTHGGTVDLGEASIMMMASCL